MIDRRHALRSLIGFAAGSPLLAQSFQVPDELHGPINLHEFEHLAKRKLHKMAYDFIAGGVEDELTLRANREAFARTFLVPRVMVDVSEVDPSVELFGEKHDFPIFIAPTGGKNLVLPNADEVVANAAMKSRTLICSATGVQRLLNDGQAVHWWSNTTGQRDREAARAYARRIEDQGGKGIVLTVDNPYQSNRDRNNRNRFDYGYMGGGVPKEGEKREPRTPATPAMWKVHTPNLTWDYLDWVRGASKLPVIVKGILHPEDAALAVKHGASAISISNHGARQMDGVLASLDALPDCVDAVGGRIPVLMDGGVRRGSDVMKALALGAKAVLIGRPPLWGLAAFGQEGVERVLWMLGAEFKLSMGLCGTPRVSAINRSLVKRKLI
jgi:isopentenyl diphosphate isomerase/L-lactate dehydrogenase-like FMN-dependent dehydrogenase